MIAGLERLTSIGQASRLEIQVRVDFAILSPNSAEQQARFPCCSLEVSSYFGKAQSLSISLQIPG